MTDSRERQIGEQNGSNPVVAQLPCPGYKRLNGCQGEDGKGYSAGFILSQRRTYGGCECYMTPD